MVIALVIVSLMIYVSQQAFYMEKPDAERESQYPSLLKLWVGLLWVLAIVQVILGTQFREAIEIAGEHFPLLFGSSLLAHVSAIKLYHPIVGVIFALLTLYVVYKLVYKSQNPSSLNWQCGWTMAGLVIIQILLGAGMISVGFSAVTQVLHLWLASLIVGVILISFTALGQNREV